MSGAKARLSGLLGHLPPSQPGTTTAQHQVNRHTLSPTFFLPRAAAIEPEVCRGNLSSDGSVIVTVAIRKAPAIHHLTANNKVLRRSYKQFAERARGLAYYLKKHAYKRVGILCPNTPAFLESIFGIAAAGGTNVGMVNPGRLRTLLMIWQL
jgi:AMP-binding enzyme